MFIILSPDYQKIQQFEIFGKFWDSTRIRSISNVSNNIFLTTINFYIINSLLKLSRYYEKLIKIYNLH